MSQNSHVPPSGTPVYTGEVIHSDHSPAVPSVPGPSSVPDRSDPTRHQAAYVPGAYPDPSRNDPQVPVQSFEPPPWTDEDYLQYARSRYGHEFTSAAARAFMSFDAESGDIQAAEFYRFRDEQLDLFGYF